MIKYEDNFGNLLFNDAAYFEKFVKGWLFGLSYYDTGVYKQWWATSSYDEDVSYRGRCNRCQM
jgi:hypothetical protein